MKMGENAGISLFLSLAKGSLTLAQSAFPEMKTIENNIRSHIDIETRGSDTILGNSD